MRIASLLNLLLAGTTAVLVRRNRRLAAEARHDPLTGLPNRRKLLRHWQRLRQPRALIFVDLNGFKALNDRLGHAVGDRLLRQVASRLGRVVTAPALLARWGGDEFAIALPAADAERQQQLLETVIQPGFNLDLEDRRQVTIGLSLGCCVGLDDLDEAVMRASTNLGQMRGR